MKAFVISINWYGPYSRGELAEAAYAGGFWSALYLARGLRPDGGIPGLRYIGISLTNYPYRVWETHPRLDEVERTGPAEMWGGVVTYHHAPDLGASNGSEKYTSTVDFAETVLVYLLQPDLNRAKRITPPADPAIIVNRWFDGTDLTTRRDRPDSSIPDFIEYDPEIGATLAWHEASARIKRIDRAALIALGTSSGRTSGVATSPTPTLGRS